MRKIFGLVAGAAVAVQGFGLIALGAVLIVLTFKR